MMVPKRFRSEYCSHHPAGKQQHAFQKGFVIFRVAVVSVLDSSSSATSVFIGRNRLQCESVFHLQPHICLSSPADFVLLVFAHRVADCRPVPSSRAVNAAVFHAISTSWLLWCWNSGGARPACLPASLLSVVYLCLLFLLFPSPEPAPPRPVIQTDSSGKNLDCGRELCVTVTHAASHWCCCLSSGAEYQDMEVNLRRQKSGFGFRVLGGDEAGQPLSPETREKARMATGEEPCHLLPFEHQTHTHTHIHRLCMHLTFDPLRECCCLWLLRCSLEPEHLHHNNLLNLTHDFIVVGS